MRRGLGLLGLFTVIALIGSTASAASIITHETITSPIFETGLTDDCLPGLTGTLVGTDVLSVQRVETPQGVHANGAFIDTGRIDWTDGSYTLVESIDRFSFNAVGQGTSVLTVAHTDSGDFFSPNGVFEFRGTFHLIQHFTVTNGDVTRVDFERALHFQVFGGC